MSTLSPLVRRVEGWHRPMLSVAVVMAALAVASVIGLLVDHRVLLGAPIWLKPFKFAVSNAIYALTWAWLFSLLKKNRVLANGTTNVLVAVIYVEYALILVQVLRGRPSHFNFSTPADAIIYSVMGVSIGVLWTGALILTILVLRAPIADVAVRWSLRLGVLISLAGISLGALMVTPTATQLKSMQSGAFAGMIGAHSVGVEDGGATMPVTGWSATGGDLRIPHFVGMHALQALPIVLGLLVLLAPRVPRLRSAVVRARLVVVAAAGYAGLVGLVTWQAERGQSIIQPDVLTLAVLGVLVTGVVVGAAVSLARPVSVREGSVEYRPTARL
ncbi:hypothetical protein ABZU76_28730 [Amycolatopsis sp. NPDC005232]|uniref:hypothetical protein n=1 Tax=Amycolatopsis sp. NPDC005232 TaxID=3157027 RepID=UPI0033ACC04B